MNAQLAATNTYTIVRNSDLEDVFRLQRDLIEKANTKKFSTKPKSNWINLVGVDVSEIQLGTVDIFDCIIAAAGRYGSLGLQVDSGNRLESCAGQESGGTRTGADYSPDCPRLSSRK